MPDCNRITTGYTFQNKEVITPKKLNKALNEACINLDDILADILENAGDIDDLEDILDQLLNPPGGFGLVGVTIQQGVNTMANGTNIRVGTIDLILPPQRKWTHIKVYTSLVFASSNLATWRDMRVNGVNQPGGSNINPLISVYGTNNNDDSDTLNHNYDYIPTAPLANQNIRPRWAVISISAVASAKMALYAVGWHEAVLT